MFVYIYLIIENKVTDCKSNSEELNSSKFIFFFRTLKSEKKYDLTKNLKSASIDFAPSQKSHCSDKLSEETNRRKIYFN